MLLSIDRSNPTSSAFSCYIPCAPAYAVYWARGRNRRAKRVACQVHPHAAIAGRIANMVYSELSDYARSKLSPRFTDSGYQFEHVDPLFEEDSSKSARWVYFEKAGVPITATLASGEKLTGTIVPMAGQKGRAHLTIRKEDGTCARVPWADVITIDPAEPAPRDA